MRVYLQDEWPRLGAGWRDITVTKIGYKWVHLVAQKAGRIVKRKMRKAQWKLLHEDEISKS